MRASFWGVLIAVLAVSVVFSLPVNYQGKLTYSGGVGINDTFDVAMSIWDDPTAGTMVDADTVSGVVVYHGLFSTIFDIDIPPAYSSTPLYIQISVDTTGTGTWVTLSPRQVITAAFWAMWTNNSVNAIYADTASYVLGNNVEYDNSGSGLASGTVQGAIDELADSLNTVDLQKAYDNGNTILGDNSLSVTLNPGFGRAIYARVGKDGPFSSTAAAVYARNDSTGPAIYANGNIVQASGKYIGTNGDVRVLLDINNNSDDHFRVYNGDSAVVFDVNEYGLARVSGIQVDSINLGGDWHTKFFQQLRAEGNPWLGDSVTFVAGSNITLTQTGDTIEISATGGGTVNDSNFIQNQDTVAQEASFWIKNKGTIGGVTTYGPAERITGTGTSSTGFRPLADYYHYCRSAVLITADEIGVDGPCVIDTLGLYIAEADSDAWIYDSVRIWIEMTTATSAPTTWDVSGATLVFSSDSLYLEQNTGWYNFDITDFNYDGTSNIIIYFQNGNQHTLYSSNGPDWRYTTQPTSDYFSYNTSDSDWGTSMTHSTSRPDVRLHMENVPSIVDKVEIESGEVRADNDVIIGGTALSSAGGAGLIGYDNSASGLAATNVQAAIDEIKGNVDSLGSSEDYIHNQIAEPQDADLWIDGRGYFGAEYVFTDTAWTESFEDAPDSLTPPTNWAVDTVNHSSGDDPVVSFEGSTKNPSGYSPSDGSVLVRFNSYDCYYDASSRLKQTAGTDMTTLGWTEAAVVFDMFHDDYYSASDDRVVVQYSTDGGATWVSLDTFHRYSSAGDYWATEVCILPASVMSATGLRIAFLFISDYGNDVYIDNVHLVKVERPGIVKIESGKVEASDTIKGAHFRDFSGDLLLRSSDGSVNITEDADGSYDLTVSGGGSGCVTLDGAYDCGGAGAGATITADAGPVVIDASSATNGALNVLANSSTNSALYVSNTGGGNGIWNDANYWSPHGNVATGTGFFHTDTGWFQSNTDFVVKIDADDNSDNMFKVENSAGSVMFEVDEYGNVAIANNLLIATGGINDGVGTGAAGQVLTADGSGHFHWAYPLASDVNFSVTTVAQNTDYTVNDDDYTILVNTGSDATNTQITLPDASGCSGRVLVIKKIDSGTDGIDLVTSGTQTVDGMDDPTNVITTQYHAITIQSDGSNWWVIGTVGF